MVYLGGRQKMGRRDEEVYQQIFVTTQLTIFSFVYERT